MTEQVRPGTNRHYSYKVYADPAVARAFDDRRFGGPIGELIAADQGEAIAAFVGNQIGGRALDVGTGTGRAAFLLARRGAQVTGVDASEEMLAVARQRAAAERLTVTFCRGDAQYLDFPDRAFDLVVSLRVIMHVPDWRRALAEICRVSERLVVLDYPSARSAALFQTIVRWILYAAGLQTEPYRVFTDRRIRRALAENGFHVRASHRQFTLPIALHKKIGSRRFTITVERLLARAGLVRIFGSPVTIVAERCSPS